MSRQKASSRPTGSKLTRRWRHRLDVEGGDAESPLLVYRSDVWTMGRDSLRCRRRMGRHETRTRRVSNDRAGRTNHRINLTRIGCNSDARWIAGGAVVAADSRLLRVGGAWPDPRLKLSEQKASAQATLAVCEVPWRPSAVCFPAGSACSNFRAVRCNTEQRRAQPRHHARSHRSLPHSGKAP